MVREKIFFWETLPSPLTISNHVMFMGGGMHRLGGDMYHCTNKRLKNIIIVLDLNPTRNTQMPPGLTLRSQIESSLPKTPVTIGGQESPKAVYQESESYSKQSNTLDMLSSAYLELLLYSPEPLLYPPELTPEGTLGFPFSCRLTLSVAAGLYWYL